MCSIFSLGLNILLIILKTSDFTIDSSSSSSSSLKLDTYITNVFQFQLEFSYYFRINLMLYVVVLFALGSFLAVEDAVCKRERMQYYTRAK